MRRPIKFLIAIVFIIIVIILIVAGYNFVSNFTYTRHITLPPQLLASSSTDATSSDSGLVIQNNPDVFGQTNPSSLIPASSTIDTTSWNMHVSNTLGYTIQYPKDVLVNADVPGNLTVVMPKDTYFHWPLLDDIKITVTASSSCPELISGATHPDTVITEDNGLTFVRNEGSDVGAGNLYRELAYDVTKNGTCYHIDLFDHGTNGAGFYVSDQDLIARYNAQHQTDLNAVVSIFVAMVNSFRVVSPQ